MPFDTELSNRKIESQTSAKVFCKKRKVPDENAVFSNHIFFNKIIKKIILLKLIAPTTVIKESYPIILPAIKVKSNL